MIFSTEYLTIIVTCILIFCARILDVSIGTMRIIFVSKGYRRWAPILGFFEVFIWIMAISRIMQHIDRFAYYVAYAAGFASGNWIGMILEERLAIGLERVRFFVKVHVLDSFRNNTMTKHRYVCYSAEYAQQPITVFEVTANRKQIAHLVRSVHDEFPDIPYMREDVKISTL